MGLPTQFPLTPAPADFRLGNRGIALPAAMFALVAVSVLVAGAFAFADLSAKATLNQERATRAVQVAEAGVSHTLSLLRGNLRMHNFTRILRGSDNAITSAAQRADDSLMTGYGLSADDQIPLAGKAFQGGTYFVSVRDDSADTDGNPSADMNGRVRVRCRAVMADGSAAEVNAIIGAIPFPAVAANGNLAYSGSAQVVGACGGVHANGNVTSGGNPVVGTMVTATGTVVGDFDLPDGSNAPRLGLQPPIAIPTLAPLTHCLGADFRLRGDGSVVHPVTGASLGASPFNGWVRSNGPPEVKWDLSGPSAVNGTYCVEGNATISGNTGTTATPARLSVIATGSIEVSGNPFLAAEHDDGIMFLAGGDVSVSGNPGAGAENYQGLIYAGAQCKVSGNPEIFGQLLCANGAQPVNALNIISIHEMSGNFSLTYDCSGTVFNRRRVLYWYPRIGA